MNTSEVIRFYRVHEPFGNFSNFAPFAILIGTEIWPTVEHYFQASKFEDFSLKDKIRSMISPMDAAIEGRNINNPLRPDWDAVKDSIMLKALRAKFYQSPRLKKELQSTGNALIIEHTHNDNYWGDGGDGSGRNRLGELLMEVRNSLNAFSTDSNLILPPWIAFPTTSPYDMFWRMGRGEDYICMWAKYLTSTNEETYQHLFPPPQDWENAYDN